MEARQLTLPSAATIPTSVVAVCAQGSNERAHALRTLLPCRIWLCTSVAVPLLALCSALALRSSRFPGMWASPRPGTSVWILAILNAYSLHFVGRLCYAKVFSAHFFHSKAHRHAFGYCHPCSDVSILFDITLLCSLNFVTTFTDLDCSSAFHVCLVTCLVTIAGIRSLNAPIFSSHLHFSAV